MKSILLRLLEGVLLVLAFAGFLAGVLLQMPWLFIAGVIDYLALMLMLPMLSQDEQKLEDRCEQDPYGGGK